MNYEINCFIFYLSHPFQFYTMSYFIVPSLKEKASVQVALNLCQKEDFKEVALNLEKPTYGGFLLTCYSTFFVSPEDMSKLAEKMYWKKVRYWEKKVVEQCQKLTEEVPHFLKINVQPWIMHIALEYLSYCRRQELLFSVSRYFLLNFLTRSDWTADGRLDEKKLAERLLKDEQLGVLQRYRIACVYCLFESIPALFKRLTNLERVSIRKIDYCYESCKTLIDIWTDECCRNCNEAITMQRNNDLWFIVMVELVRHGNKSVLVPLWKKLDEQLQQEIIIKLAITSLQKWQNVYYKSTWYFMLTKKLVLNELPLTINHFNLPSYYSHLVFFFLSEMNKKQQLEFFRQAFKMSVSVSPYTLHLPVLECLLDWPFQENFLQTIKQLWEVIPKDLYKRCFITLASKYSGNYYFCHGYDLITEILERGFCTTHNSHIVYENENRYYDYQNLLCKLWDETPQDYKQYLLSVNKECNFPFNGSVNLLYPQLLDKSPFREVDEVFFKRIFCDLSDEEKLALINSKTGKVIRFLLAGKENWLLSDWLLHQCLPEEKIPCYKKQFIRSSCGRKLCFYNLKRNNQKFLTNFIDWSFRWDSQKRIYRTKLIFSSKSVMECSDYLCQGDFAKIESKINFFSLSDVKKSLFMKNVIFHACFRIHEFELDQLDNILVWSLGTDEKIQEYKNYLFSRIGSNMFFKCLFKSKDFRSVECFYEWFGLSPIQIKNLQKEFFKLKHVYPIIEDILFHDKIGVAFEAPLCWFLTDEEMVIYFKEYCETYFFPLLESNEEITLAKERLSNLINKLLLDLKEKVQNDTSKESDIWKDRPKKRSVVNEFQPPNKRFK